MKKDTESMWRGTTTTTTELVIKGEEINNKVKEKIEKQIEEWENNSDHVSFKKVCNIIGILGFKYRQGSRGSHRVFVHKNTKEEIMISVNEKGKLGFKQAREVLKIIKKYL